MVMHALFSLIRKIFGDIEVGVLGWFDYLGVNFEGKSSEISKVDPSACKYLFFDVLSECLYHKVELRLGVKGLD